MEADEAPLAYEPPDTIELGGLPVASRGAQGDHVRLIQHYLNLWGFEHTPLTVHGRFSQQTAMAVSAFQTMFKLIPDGVVWPNTWQTLIPHAPTAAERAAKIRGILFTTFRIHRR